MSTPGFDGDGDLRLCSTDGPTLLPGKPGFGLGSAQILHLRTLKHKDSAETPNAVRQKLGPSHAVSRLAYAAVIGAIQMARMPKKTRRPNANKSELAALLNARLCRYTTSQLRKNLEK